jgi:hypothetical protein
MGEEPTQQQRAFGRSLRDFLSLNRAEQEVIAASREGRIAHFGDEIPQTKRKRQARSVRAGLVRFLALGGDKSTRVHEHGVQIEGAVIKGALDLEGCTVTSDLLLSKCELADTLTLRGARTRSVGLEGSLCREIQAALAEVSGGLYLRGGFVAQGVVVLIGAKITGNLECVGGRFEGRDANGRALVCDGIHVGGYALLRDVILTRGAVNLLRGKITHNLECSGGRFEGCDADGHALICNGIQVGGSIFLRRGFTVCHDAIFLGASVNGDVVCQDGTFGAAPASTAEKSGGVASINQGQTVGSVNLARSTIKGTLWLSGPSKAKFHGDFNLTGARVGRIVDGVSLSTKRRVANSSPDGAGDCPATLHLDGFTYDRFGESTILTAAARLAFLRLQSAKDLGKDFKPQPWMQMVKVLRDTGHAEAAREVAIAYEDERRKAGTIRSKIARFLHWLYGLLVGYGHGPMKLLRITFSMWLLCAGLYFTAAEIGVMAPTNPRVYDESKHAPCRPENGGNWTTCDKAPYEYTTFNPWVYSLDLMLPFVDLHQDRDWAPMMMQPCAVTKSIFVTEICWQSTVDARTISDSPPATKPAYWMTGTFVAAVMWFEILFGWAASLLLAAVLSGLAKRVE